MADNCTVITTEYKLFLETFEIQRISTIVSLLFLLVILVVEIYYICRYKSNFTFHLFFYMTFVAIAVDASIALNIYLRLLCLTSEAYIYLYLISISGVSAYVQYIEVMLFFSIQVTFVTKMYVSIADGRLNSLRSLRLFCSRHPKKSEVMFVIVLIILPVPILIGIVANGLINGSTLQVFEYVFLAQIILSIIISCFFAVLLIWFLCILRRKNLLKKRTKLVCKEIGFIIWAQLVPAVFFIAVLSYRWHSLTTNSEYFSAVMTPIIQVFIPAGAFFYIILTIYEQKKKAKSHVCRRKNASLGHSVPPSSRVSLPTDTAAHAPDFLSPSTAGPTETTGLVNSQAYV